MIYAIGDVHGRLDALRAWVEHLGGAAAFAGGGDRLILLGDYVDCGPRSRETLEYIRELTEAAPGRVIALMGNHDQWFLDFADGRNGGWLSADRNLQTVRTFLTRPQLLTLVRLIKSRNAAEARSYARRCIRRNHAPLLSWLRALPLYYETERTIFVHAGVDEEAGKYWKQGTPEAYFTGKFPPQTGRFYKDIVAGHVSAASAARVPGHEGVFFDGESHYFIDGGEKLLCLACDEETGRYSEIKLSQKTGG